MRALTVATVTAFAATIGFASIASAQQPAAQQPDCDLEAIHKAYWNLNGSSSEAALQQLETEANRYYYGDDYVRIAASRPYLGGQPVTVISGYLEKDGVDGLTSGDRVLFRFAQTGPMQGYSLPYEFMDGSGVVFYRGSRIIPRMPFYMSYYYRPIGTIGYYTPSARIGFLRSWRMGWRMSPSFVTYRTRFYGFRTSYASRIAFARRTYGTSRFVASFGHRPVFRSSVVARPGIRATVTTRPAFRGHVARPVSRTTTVRTTVTSRPAFRGHVARPSTRTTTVRTTTHTTVRGRR